MAEHAHITPTSTVPPQSRRRTLFAAASAVIMGSGITAGAAASVADLEPSADLLASCADYLRIQLAWSAYCEALDSDVEENDPNVSMLDPLPAIEERIVALSATTAEGHVARARCMAFWYLPNHRIAQDDPRGAMEDRFQAALYRDLIAQERCEMQAGRA